MWWLANEIVTLPTPPQHTPLWYEGGGGGAGGAGGPGLEINFFVRKPTGDKWEKFGHQILNFARQIVL